ncbi:MAG: UDP-N-acetylmuramoyl-L-alanyl-D-glutamate--2,6-diaminopimelate ligase [Bacteroidaceae bacterium]|nr:UDP-N-acetylmuramoyl-L-alanyl-D-glutamate--2,6-diaminopimelate ligase [Bacteroidaceae bacterium]MBR3895409.1 UDP-N-acetylmuramoyl-L-alanyl-D-glutamate--2,6-diaminopimelate ligase [Bacteroidaceae bacterium]
MKLQEIIQGLETTNIYGPTSIDINGVHIDSRKVAKGDLFIAMRGTQSDGHAFIPKAIEAGAIAVLCEEVPEMMKDFEEVAFICVPNTEMIAGVVATRFYGNPTSKLKLVGVTGTNGKTTIATLLYRMFRQMGHKVGLLSTVCNYIDDKAVPSTHTTPDPISLNSLLGQMAEEGCEYAFMEVSSHSVAQHRIAGLEFAGGVFTNLTRDHLDYHKTVENYLKAKKKFFDDLKKNTFVVTNLDDRNGLVMTQNTQAKVATYSLRNLSDFKGRILEDHFEGMLIDFNGHETAVQFVGKFNASNLLAVFGTAVMLGKDTDEVLRVLSMLKPVSGRFETVRSPKGYTAIVDYAHTPDAIANVLSSIKEVLGSRGDIITVVGAGGNRDKGKRPLMAQEAVKGSNRVIITSDNPRFEEPADIINDMLAGLTDEERQNVLSITDRREAIRTACMLAKPNDVILIAGKGHEDYQDIKGVKHHFDDKEEVKKAMGCNS